MVDLKAGMYYVLGGVLFSSGPFDKIGVARNEARQNSEKLPKCKFLVVFAQSSKDFGDALEAYKNGKRVDIES